MLKDLPINDPKALELIGQSEIKMYSLINKLQFISNISDDDNANAAFVDMNNYILSSLLQTPDRMVAVIAALLQDEWIRKRLNEFFDGDYIIAEGKDINQDKDNPFKVVVKEENKGADDDEDDGGI